MKRCQPPAAVLLSLLSLLVLPAHAGSTSARMQVSFVVKAACTVDRSQASARPDVACSDATPYRVAPAGARGGAGWTVTF